MRKVELLPTRDSEACYGPVYIHLQLTLYLTRLFFVIYLAGGGGGGGFPYLKIPIGFACSEIIKVGGEVKSSQICKYCKTIKLILQAIYFLQIFGKAQIS